jgi:lactate dehydrogenase-like 2-hydroxyacid dehydrogenase
MVEAGTPKPPVTLKEKSHMTVEKPDLLLVGPSKPLLARCLEPVFTVHRLIEADDREALLSKIADRVRAFAVTYTNQKIDAPFMQRFPKLEFVSSFGVGYDHVDARWAGGHGIIVTNTPNVLDEEVADTTLGLLLCTVREFPQADRFLRAGKWAQGPYPLSPATLRDRTMGIVGMGRIGQAIARRLEAFKVPIVYHSRRPQAGVPYKHYPVLLDMAREVDVLIVIVPGGAETRNMINAEVLDALGPTGIVINMARGSVVDEPALIVALREKKIFAAGLDVFVNEPKVPQELIEMENVVLLPHLGSASAYTRAAMDQLVVDNLLSWAAGKGPVTPVPETPPKK